MKISSMEIQFRNATDADINELTALGLTAYSEFANYLTPDNWLLMKTNLESTERTSVLLDMSTCIVAVAEERIVGMAYFIASGHPTPIYPAEWSYVRLVGVAPDCRGMGLGKQLMQQCIALARESGERTIALHTSEIMHAARAIYESLGFTIVKELPEHLGIRYWLYALNVEPVK